ncbi:benzoate 4-monooxygenase cytochrome P450 [Aspergillus sclerotioniger CBS 115572]|uniref:Benzoate 4-monooxygenase cytochrome P450 n=1 Tax=Aspergillus sclerotioniger CBS 115572 TaxID=1450535 RepID=A0A317V2X3_9EURO|nr:benzoate 4-monooxygenase cytochrome P450 [Aspergillus sclerotioniger CBS 115572]PWY67989.1 benzoate 4-monooxygenase cytochrome P450 [Aspergillus sclerotioniger CBS 115572]
MAVFDVMSFGLGVGVTLVLACGLCHVCYNVFLHPLRKYPGPVLWAATRLPWCWYQAQGRLNQKLLELHLRYGQTVRVAPNELSYTSEEAWKGIYGPRGDEMGKDPVFSLRTPTGVQNILTADRPTHTRQRRLLSHAFSEKALREQEGIIQGYVDQLMEQLSSRAGDGPHNMVDWFTFIAYDLIRDLSFGERFHCLDQAEYDPFVRSIRAISKELTFIQMFAYYGLLRVRQLFMPKAIAGARAQNMQRVIETVNRRVARDTNRKDFLHYILAAMETEKGMSAAEMNVNAFSFSIAGSESSATALSAFTYYILTHAEVYKRLVVEIRGAFSTYEQIEFSALTRLPYLNAVLQETLRIYPPVAVTLPRVVPANGAIIDGQFVPAGVTVGVNHFACYHDPRNFHRPMDFLPDRWLPECQDTFKDDHRNSFQPFSFGPRNCLGKNLAWAEMRLIAAKLLFWFDLELSEGSRGWEEGRRCLVFGLSRGCLLR